jgi:hypothetical protein
MTAEGGKKDERIELLTGKNLYLRGNCVFNSEFSSWDLENSYLKGLVPSKDVLNLIKDLDTSNFIGVHIRMEGAKGLDSAYEKPDGNWTKEEHELLNSWRLKSHYVNFIKRLDRSDVINNKIFLATDRKENYEYVLNNYGDRVSYLKRDIFDRSREQIIYALADAILLSKCNRLIGSGWSSFTELALRLSKNYTNIEQSGIDF